MSGVSNEPKKDEIPVVVVAGSRRTPNADSPPVQVRGGGSLQGWLLLLLVVAVMSMLSISYFFERSSFEEQAKKRIKSRGKLGDESTVRVNYAYPTWMVAGFGFAAILLIWLVVSLVNNWWTDHTVNNNSVIQVLGSHTSKVQPDLLTLKMDIDACAQTAEGAKHELQNQLDQLVNELGRAGIPIGDIRFDHANVTPKMFPPSFLAYRCVTVETPLVVDNINAIVLAANEMCTNEDGYTISFGLSASLMQKEIDKTKVVAIEKAESEAACVASSENRQLGDALQIDMEPSAHNPKVTPLTFNSETVTSDEISSAVDPTSDVKVTVECSVIGKFTLLPAVCATNGHH